jgi:hypothetical protein
MDDRELRLACLKLAIDRGGATDAAIDEARRFADFAAGKTDAEIIDKARDIARIVSGYPSQP